MPTSRRIIGGIARLLAAGVVCCGTAALALGADQVLDVRDFGAKPDGKTLCTQAIQKAIDQCAAQGGGTVYLPPGTWLSGAIFMKSRVALRLDSGCTLLGSRNPDDYLQPSTSSDPRSGPGSRASCGLIVGTELEHVTIQGRGTIDGNGSAFRHKGPGRPKAIVMVNCRDVLIEDVSMQSAGSWMQHYRNCDQLTLRGVTVFNHASFNNDGLDIDSCRDVSVSECRIDSDDDALCLKSASNRPCENVTIANCVISSHCNAIKMGTESGGGFQNVTISNCTVCCSRCSEVFFGKARGLAGIALEIVDGGHLDRVTVSNVTIQGVTAPIFLRLGNRARAYTQSDSQPAVGTFRNVSLSNIVATGASGIGCSITGLPGHRIENVCLNDIRLSFEGGEGKQASLKPVAEKPDSYPECTMFGTLPAYGLYCRHVKGLKLCNVQLQTAQPDQRHAVVCDDAENVVIDGLDAQSSPNAGALVRLTQVKGAFIRGCCPQSAIDTFLRVEGSASQGIVVVGNDLSRVGKLLDAARGVPQDAVSGQVSHVDGRP